MVSTPPRIPNSSPANTSECDTPVSRLRKDRETNASPPPKIITTQIGAPELRTRTASWDPPTSPTETYAKTKTVASEPIAYYSQYYSNDQLLKNVLEKAMQQHQRRAVNAQQTTPEHLNRYATISPLTMMNVPLSPTKSDVLSTTESEVASFDGLPRQLQDHWNNQQYNRTAILQKLDGVEKKETRNDTEHNPTPTTNTAPLLDFWPLNLFCGASEITQQQGKPPKSPDRVTVQHRRRSSWDSLGLLEFHPQTVPKPALVVPSSLVRVAENNEQRPTHERVDWRMQDWIDNQYTIMAKPPADGAFYLGVSRTVIVHEIVRGDWTWCTAWSPDGKTLAIATENHHLAIVDTTSSSVWRVTHDKRLRGPPKIDTTHSVRAIAWGSRFIALGGTGNAVSLLDTKRELHTIAHTIRNTGFVGSLHWKPHSNILAIASRLNKVFIVRVVTEPKEESQTAADEKDEVIKSHLVKTLEFSNWVNRVMFSPDGTYLAVGDASGIISIYQFFEESPDQIELQLYKTFQAEDSVLDLVWAPDGRWLYSGGEDFRVTVIDTSFWEVVHRIKRDRWVQCVSCSNSGTHLAVGGVASEITLLDVRDGWDSVLSIELKGLVPLSANWHPRDQFLCLTGQNDSIIAVETTNSRHVKGHHLQSISPVTAIEFSPDGRMVVMGNETGVVTFFWLSGTTFITAYELVVTLNDRLSMQWSLDDRFVVIGAKDAILIVQRRPESVDPSRRALPPNAAEFSVRKVIREFGETNAVSIDSHCHYIAVSGIRTRILDVSKDFKVIQEWKNGPCYDNAWSPDGRWLATIGLEKLLTIYDTSDPRVDRWRPVFSIKCDFVGFALAWGPLVVGDLLYLAYGGDSKEINIIEIRAQKRAWETVLRIPREEKINALDWNSDGLLAAAIGNGTISIADMSYLFSGTAVNEMDYNWQRQALTCFTEIRRNRGKNSMRTVKFIPSAPGSDTLLAIGGDDGEVEIIDLTKRDRHRDRSP